jgi:hypothetical protein
MYALLLILGAVVAVAGVLIAAPGLPLQGRDFDASIITPGAVAVVGGLILIGLGLAVRVLTRIEKALVEKPIPRTVVRGEDEVVAAPAAEPTNTAPVRNPTPRKPVAEPRPQPTPAVAAAPAPPEDTALNRLREQFPTLTRLENAPVVDETDMSLLPGSLARVDEDAAEVNNAVVQGQDQANGAPAKIEPRLELHVRPASRPERPRNFDAFWPKKQRQERGPVPAAQPAAVAPPAPAVQSTAPAAAPALRIEPALPAEPTQFQFREPAAEPLSMGAASEAVPISILKSGMVDGMAYTLYSDGSIEAQLPQGTLRFGSITELRNHIEQSA